MREETRIAKKTGKNRGCQWPDSNARIQMSRRLDSVQERRTLCRLTHEHRRQRKKWDVSISTSHKESKNVSRASREEARV